MLCFGSSVLDSRNRPIAGVAVSIPAEKLSEGDKRKIINNVQRIATNLSHRMGADLSQILWASPERKLRASPAKIEAISRTPSRKKG